jgi:hypothetical protein
MPVKLYRKKAIVIGAIEWEGGNTQDVLDFVGRNSARYNNTNGSHIYINTMEGEMKASVGDWIIKGVMGEFYPCKPDIFRQVYELT